MFDSIELLDTELLNSKNEFKYIYNWIKLFGSEIGWHYSLDLIWQLKKIEELKLPKGSTILDAGAGYGMMQFILASRGYNIISVDFSQRSNKLPFSLLFKITINNTGTFNNEYIKLINKSRSYHQQFLRIINKIRKIQKFKLLFKSLQKNDFGRIDFYRANFSDLSFLMDNQIDAIVSTSAIEHNEDLTMLKGCIREFERILKEKSYLFITTSATNGESWFHEPSKGWCFNESTIKGIFNLKNDCLSNFDTYETIFNNIRNNEFLKNNMPGYYYKNENCGMPLGIWDPKYIPVGIIKQKG